MDATSTNTNQDERTSTVEWKRYRRNRKDPVQAAGINADEHPPQRCRRCGCSDDCRMNCIRRTGKRCYWVQHGLCSACLRPEEFVNREVVLLEPILSAGEVVFAPGTLFRVVDESKGMLRLARRVEHLLLRIPWPVPYDKVQAVFQFHEPWPKSRKSLLEGI